MRKQQKMALTIHFFILTSAFFNMASLQVGATSPKWSSTITGQQIHHWKAIKSELRNLRTEERYFSWNLVGGISIPGGGMVLSLLSPPPSRFDFFNGTRLNVAFSLEGDTGPHVTVNGSDYHLLLLPTTLDNISFFDQLFREKHLLESMSHSTFLNSTISNTTAIAWLKYSDILDVKYEWDIQTGILIRKTVTAPSGHQLVVIPGKGSPYDGSGVLLNFIPILIIVGILGFFGILGSRTVLLYVRRRR